VADLSSAVRNLTPGQRGISHPGAWFYRANAIAPS
jgi:hypothetical protein